MKIFYLIVFLWSGLFTHSQNTFQQESANDDEIIRLNEQVRNLRTMIGSNSKYNTKIAFLLDMKIKSGKNRFFVYDLVNNVILDEGLVAHGSGSETGIRGNLKFSNVPNSRATSLGRYSVERAYKGIFGKAYRLLGLDQSNNNASKRAIVLHHYSAVPCEEQDYYISNSQGCPMINEDFFKRIEKLIDTSKSNIIMDIYY
ncbi:murein L,D-transpeptidase catalytic domain family protein [Flavobacterium branchiarum]|uniref:Murein L,D-transpeptidase catalytic domain-containing protein n=1 Tax=Flavobacterium branchiarum TaxID=1114870 RepID=A0ABV5FHB0_9FLAO|nr:murein L,D-transpeptidase catalytic domain family protein [Flavobacterium branchiarum]MDN3673828.1 murein L,D-transpeptidase catalytic domain family protein [Flavobacterium branchiarum]